MKPSTRIGSVLALALAFAAFSACDTKIEITDGKIPDKLIAQAQTMTGTYNGHFAGQPATISASIDPSNRFVMTAAGDLLGAECASVIGNLQVIYTNENRDTKEQEITSAVFAFDPAKCFRQAEGREISLDFDHSARSGHLEVDARIFRYSVWESCKDGSSADFDDSRDVRPPPFHPGPICHRHRIPLYLTGSFIKN